MVNSSFPEEAVNFFLRTNTTDFSLKGLKKKLNTQNIRISLTTLSDYIQDHPLVFSKENDVFISRAGVFTDRFFSIKPSKAEVSLGVLIPGHRCMPFSDPEIYPHELVFTSDEVVLKQKTCKVPLDDVLTSYELYGEEYIPQFIAIDPVNAGCNFMETEYELPNSINLTVCDMKKLYKQWNFSYGDRILARVVNWNVGIIELQPIKENRSTPFEFTDDDEFRIRWFCDVEESLEHVIAAYGPLSSMEEQIAYAFFGAIDKLCVPQCSSLEQYLPMAVKLGIEQYGVESRLWEKGEEIPAVGIWSKHSVEDEDLEDTLYSEIGIPIPTHMLDAYVLDALYRKETECTNMMQRIIPDVYSLDEIQIQLFLLHLNTKYSILSKTYNRFLDFEKGRLRNEALKLYSDLVELICLLNLCGTRVDSFPQQPLVTLSQLFAHTAMFIETFLCEQPLSEQDVFVASASLEGMRESFEDIAEELTGAMGNGNKDGFTII